MLDDQTKAFEQSIYRDTRPMGMFKMTHNNMAFVNVYKKAGITRLFC